MTITFTGFTPILRMFDVAKADEFYVGFLGFKVDWEHRFDGNAPLYRGISRGGLVLHQSEHHGDGCPGQNLRVNMEGVEEYHKELSAKNYRYYRPGVQKTEWGTLEMGVTDPFGNRIVFSQPLPKD
jgi:catechol 2,3-dioxygenase-like lactoylglutathione lyase family enzyme